MLHLITTSDGSKTIFNDEVGENYHSHHGAFQESIHVFLNSGLKYLLQTKSIPNISILEVGFGTGLNFLLSADFCIDNSLHLNYTGIEAFPLPNSIICETGYNAYINSSLWDEFLDNYSSSINSEKELNPYFKLNIAHCKLVDFKADKQFDLLYFDAFASKLQPEMWNDEALSHACKFLKKGGVFVTYAITGNLKRSLKNLGFKIEKIPGALGKREMLRAVKL